MAGATIFFAGGGTGGHIYPALAVAERIAKFQPDAKVHFFVSSRPIDEQILSKTPFEYTRLPATGFSLRPGKLINFFRTFLASYRIAKSKIGDAEKAVVAGVGGFVAAPACYAAHRTKTPLFLINVDIIPGKANRIIARWADKIFVQFAETVEHLGKHKGKTEVVGCPVRGSFDNPDAERAKTILGLDKNKKILLITGASSGSQSINRTVCSLLDKLDGFTDTWQIVHLTGRANYDQVAAKYADARIAHKVVDYYDDMADLLAAADLLIGRSGAVSVAEYAAAAVPSICLPYPHHRDMHQYLNAGKLVEAGAAIIVDDIPDEKERNEWLWEEMEVLLKDDRMRGRMRECCRSIGSRSAAATIAEQITAGLQRVPDAEPGGFTFGSSR